MPFLLAVGLALCAISVQAAEQVTFRFAPPPGTRYIEVLEKPKTTTFGEGNVRTDQSAGRERVAIEKTANGYAITRTVLSLSMARDGQAITGIFDDLIKDLAITWEISADGKVDAIRGYDLFFARIKERLDPRVAAAMLAVMDEEKVVAKERAEWESRIGQFVGKTVALGERWAGVSEAQLPNGQTIRFYTVTTFTEMVQAGERQLLRMEFSYSADADQVAAQVGMTLEGLALAIGMTPEELPRPTGIRVTGKGERLIDPATMIIHAETTDRTLQWKMELPGHDAGLEIHSLEQRALRIEFEG